jgi:antitoxin component of MazEF toxin-antitoxin module
MATMIVKVRMQGGNLTVTLPRELARECGIVRRSYLRINRGAGRELVLAPLEVSNGARRSLRPRAARSN